MLVGVAATAIVIVVWAPEGVEGRGRCSRGTTVGHWPVRIVTIIVTVAVTPLITKRWQVIDEVKDKVSVCVLVDSQDTHIIEIIVPKAKVNRTIAVNLSVGLAAYGFVTKSQC